jgi:mono/diheme cytochrome c family protein
MKLNIRPSARILLSSGLLAALAFVAGCRQDMQNQPKMFPQRGTTLFADGRSVRPQVEHTVARGQLGEGAYFYTGLLDGKEVDMMPFPVSMQVLQRGQERFNVYCTPCHSRVGNGDGMIVQRGYKPAANFHDTERLHEPLGHFFHVMTYGYRAMPDYSAQLTPVDRWAVAAYIRALQYSQVASQSDVPSGTKVEDLTSIAQQLGYPEAFAGSWPEPPATAVHTHPTGEIVAGVPADGPNAEEVVFGKPAQAPAKTVAKPPASN